MLRELAMQLTDYDRYNVNAKFVFVANGSKVPVLGIENVLYLGKYTMYQDYPIVYYL